MFPKSILAAILVLALVTMACGITVNVPNQEFRTGVTQTMTVNVPAPDVDTAKLTLEFGAGELKLAPGAVNALVDGVATYNAEQLKPEISSAGGVVHIKTGDFNIQGFPGIQSRDLKNEWDFKLGSQPMELTLNAGAYKGDIELGGLSLRNLEVNNGAADVFLAFSQPNPVEMDRLTYSTAASQVTLSSLANANVGSLIFRGGAGDYTLDFSGQLQRDLDVTIEAGLGQVSLIVPEGVPALVNFQGGLSNVDQSGAWRQSGNTYTQEGSGPKITIRVTMGAGELRLEN